MRRVSTFVIFIFLLFTSKSFSQDPKSSQVHKTKSSAIINGSKYLLHTVEKGQTLFAIAKFYKKDINEIVLENPEAINGIKPGQVLRIPVDKKSTPVVPDTSSCIIHTVEKGETLYSITKKYNTTTDRLKALNPELKDGLKTGQQLKVPSSFAKPKMVLPPIPPTDTKMFYKGEVKSEYNIALFLPFNLEEVNATTLESIDANIDPSSKTGIALQFYEGALLAIDSLKKMKFNAKVYVYDIDDKDSLNIATLLKKPELTKMDLIIGPLYGTSFTPAAKFAKEHMIPIVSPFAKINKILFNNPYVCKVSPSEILQVEQIAHFVVDSFKLQNIIAISSQNMREYPVFNAFKRVANESLLKAGRPATDTVKLVYNINALQGMLQSERTNVVVLPSNNQSFVSDVINKLNVLNTNKNKIVLFGMQSWMQYDNMDYEYFNELEVHIPTNGFVEYEKPDTKKFVLQYRDRFKTDPAMYAFQGYDVTFYFLSALQKYGSGFLNNLSTHYANGLETSFRFSQFPSDSGFENKSVLMLKYQNYQLIKAD